MEVVAAERVVVPVTDKELYKVVAPVTWRVEEA